MPIYCTIVQRQCKEALPVHCFVIFWILLGAVPTSGTAGYCTRTFALQDILNDLFLCCDLCKYCTMPCALLDKIQKLRTAGYSTMHSELLDVVQCIGTAASFKGRAHCWYCALFWLLANSNGFCRMPCALLDTVQLPIALLYNAQCFEYGILAMPSALQDIFHNVSHC
jgi:hypothetical protein